MVWLVSFPSGVAAVAPDEGEQPFQMETYRATVIEVEDVEGGESYFGGAAVKQEVSVRIDSGPWEGERDLVNHMTGNPAYDIEVSPGDRVMIGVSGEGEFADLFIVDFVRDVPSLYLLGLFALSLLVVGGARGARTLVVLALTALAIMFVLIPALLRGFNPIVSTVVVSAVVVSFSLAIIAGRGTKTIAAVIGTVSGVLFAGVLALIFGRSAHLMGLHTQEAQMLMFTYDTVFDFRGLLFSGMILGALGAVMDVSISISSAVEELHIAGQIDDFRTLLRSGMNVGRDVLGTMSNTLILAYAGSSLPLILLLTAHRADLVSVANMDIMATEVVRALSGSVGLVLCVPVTAFVAARLRVGGARAGRARSRTARASRSSPDAESR